MIVDLSSPYVTVDPGALPRTLAVVVTPPHGCRGISLVTQDDRALDHGRGFPEPIQHLELGRVGFEIKPLYREEPFYGRYKAQSLWEDMVHGDHVQERTEWTLSLMQRNGLWRVAFRLEGDNKVFGVSRLWFLMLPDYDPDFELADADRRTIYEVLMDDDT